MGLLRRNLRHCSQTCRKNAYTSLVRSTLEYGATVWDPHSKNDIDRIERVQRRGARFILQDYKSRTPGVVTKMLADLGLPTLQERRKELRLTLLFKVAKGLVPAIPPSEYLTPFHNKRRIRAVTRSDYTSSNTVSNYELRNSKCFKPIRATTEIYKQSLFPRTIQQWNSLEDSVVNCDSVTTFKTLVASSSD